MLERELANIYIPEVTITEDTEEVQQLWAIHCQQKILFQELLEAEADSEEILEALEIFIGTRNMDAYILDIEPQVDKLLLPHSFSN